MQKLPLWSSFQYALRRSVPILIGFFPVGVAYGILMARAGYSMVWSALSSLVVYAGSLQMLMVSFLTESLPLMTIVLTALLLNSRHIFYGVSFLDKFRGYGPWRGFLIYGLTDESYSLLCAYQPREGVSEKWVHIFTTGLIWLYWVAFSALGGWVGPRIPFDVTGIDFALTALFVVILVEQLKAAGSKLPCLLAAISAVLCLALLGPERFLLPSLLVTVAALTALRPRLDKPETEGRA